ncbi:DUF998 domain-containing protein [Aurantimonas litoralis]|nr:DUF998 domain-containing protein [Aurantimonas litoralis]
MPFDATDGENAGRDRGRARLFHVCGLVGMAGWAAVTLANVVGVIVQPRDGLIADTISDLAAGRYAIIMDLGLYAFAIGIVAAAIGLGRLRPGRWSWTVASWLLTLMAVLIVVIGAYGEYGDNDTGGLVIHFPVVVAMAVSFTAAALLTAAGFHRRRRRWFWFNIVCAGLWVVGAAAFWFSPTSIDGLVERGVGLVCVVWLFAVSRLLIARAKGGAAWLSTPGAPSRT